MLLSGYLYPVAGLANPGVAVSANARLVLHSPDAVV